MGTEFEKIMEHIVVSIRSAGYEPYDQLYGYLKTGNEAYITRTGDARRLVKELDRERLQKHVNAMNGMRDLFTVLFQAQAMRPRIGYFKLKQIVLDIQTADVSLRMDWDEGAGEEWIRFIHPTEGLVMMIHDVVPIAFIKSTYNVLLIDKAITHFLVIQSENFDSAEWTVNVDRLTRDIPEIVWHASISAVDPDCFSLNDLYYATV